MSEKNANMSAPVRAEAATGKCSCWIGRNDWGGNSAEREQCAVHGFRAEAAKTELAGLRETEPLKALVDELRRRANREFMFEAGHPHMRERWTRASSAYEAAYSLLSAALEGAATGKGGK